MKIDYLARMKDLDVELFKADDAFTLLPSSVDRPLDILFRHLEQFQREIREQVDVATAWGHPRLIENIARRYNLDPDRVLPANGASNAIYLVCRLLLDKGNHVVIESPVYEPLMATPDFIGCTITYLKRRPPDYAVDLNELAGSITADTKLLILTNLHNPSGAYFSDHRLLEIAETAKRKNQNIKIIIDEIYHDLAPGDPKPAATLDDCFITLNSLTKVYGLGIIHCGWVAADRRLIKRLKHLLVLVEGTRSRLHDSIASFIVENLDEYLSRSRTLVEGNREIMIEHIRPLIDDGLLIGDIPGQGCIYFPKISGVENTDKLVKKLAEKYKVFVVPGHFFQEPGHIRIGFGGKPELLKRNLAKFVESINQILK